MSKELKNSDNIVYNKEGEVVYPEFYIVAYIVCAVALIIAILSLVISRNVQNKVSEYESRWSDVSYIESSGTSTEDTCVEDTSTDESSDTVSDAEDSTEPTEDLDKGNSETEPDTTATEPDATEVQDTQSKQDAPSTKPSEPEASQPELAGPGTTRYPVPGLTEAEQHLLSTVVYLESGSQNAECQKAVTSVILNRMMTTGMSLHSVIHAPNQFSVVGLIPTTTPSENTKALVADVLTNGATLPKCVTFFRAGHYHNWSSLVVPYAEIDGVFFSYNKTLA